MLIKDLGHLGGDVYRSLRLIDRLSGKPYYTYGSREEEQHYLQSIYYDIHDKVYWEGIDADYETIEKCRSLNWMLSDRPRIEKAYKDSYNILKEMRGKIKLEEERFYDL